MTTTTKKLLLSTVALVAFAATHASADDWSPRTVDQIKSELVSQDNKVTYTIKYGDTLSTIAEAMNIGVDVLAKLNSITDINLIFPDTVLTATYNSNQEATSLQIETPATASDDNQVVASADLTTNEVTFKDQTVNLDQVQTPVASSVVASEPASSEVTADTTSATNIQAQTAAILEQKAAAEAAVANAQSSEASSEVASEVSGQEASATSEQASSEVSSEAATSGVSSEASSSEASSEAASEEAQVSETSSDASSETSESSTADIASMTAEILAQKASAEAAQSEQASSEAPTSETASSEVSSESATQTTASSEASSEITSEAPAASETAQTVVPTTPNTGLTAHAIEVKNQIANATGITNIGGYRAGDQDHGTGTALDIMVSSSAEGAAVAQYVIDNYASLGVSYIIWEQQFYSTQNNIYGAANTWGAMPDRGSATANHYDHVHVSLTY